MMAQRAIQQPQQVILQAPLQQHKVWKPQRWEHKFIHTNEVSIIGAGLEIGQGLDGTSHTPQVFRDWYFGNNKHMERDSEIDWKIKDVGDIDFPGIWKATGRKYADPKDVNVKRCQQIGVSNRHISQAVQRELQFGNFALTIGGDHSIGFGTVHGVKKHRDDAVVIWVDAHADINTPDTSGSGNMHGMPVSGLLNLYNYSKLPGWGWFGNGGLKPSEIVYIGLRDVDKPERGILRDLGIQAYGMHAIDKLGIGRVMEETLGLLNPNLDKPIHLSFDIDSVDPFFAPSTGTISDGGLTLREAHYLCEALASTGCLCSMDLVEVNPKLRQGAKAGRAWDVQGLNEKEGDEVAQKTLELAWDLVESSLAKEVF